MKPVTTIIFNYIICEIKYEKPYDKCNGYVVLFFVFTFCQKVKHEAFLTCTTVNSRSDHTDNFTILMSLYLYTGYILDRNALMYRG